MDCDVKLDCVGDVCPMPIMKTSLKMKKLRPGQVLEVSADDANIKAHMPAWCETTGNEFLGIEEDGEVIRAYARKRGEAGGIRPSWWLRSPDACLPLNGAAVSNTPRALGGRYAEAALDHFLNPRNAGEIDSPDGVGEGGDPSCGDTVRVMIRVEDDRIADIGFLAFGCPAAIAVCSALTELARGRTLDEAVEISALEVSEALGGLSPEKLHCSTMAIGALRASVKDHVLRFVKSAKDSFGKEA